MKTAIDDLFSTGKGILAIALIIGATVLAFIGRMPIGDWQNFAEWIFGSYAGAVAITKAATAIASRPVAAAPAAVAVGEIKSDQKGFASLAILIVLACLAVSLALAGCGANARTVTLRAAVATAKVTVAAMDAYTEQHEIALANAASSKEDGEAKLAAYEHRLVLVDDALNALLLAVSAAAVANDDASLAAVAPAALKLEQAFVQLKSDATGGK